MEVAGLAEVLERLRAPYASETFSVLTGVPALVVDLASPVPAGRDLEPARECLAQLPAVTVGLAAEPLSDAGAALADRFDVVATDADALAALRHGIEAQPLAALALAQLLRHTSGRSIHEALIAESLVYSVLQSGPGFERWRAGREPKPLREAGRGPAVLIQREGPTLTLTLNRPRKRNAFSVEMRDALAEALQMVISEPELECVRVRGEGAAFCSGGDLDEFGTFPDPATAHAVRSTRNPGRLLAACAERVEVRVHGACVGAGAELPAFAHRVVARQDAFFLLPEVGMGLVPGAGGTASIPRRIGRQRTAYMALTGTRVDAETALRWGLVDAVVSDLDDPV